MLNQKIMVSICCLVYNHEKYLRQCLDGFMMQKTNFKFEVLIHDDASTDGSADIIREYEKKYPDIIKPIYQTENQYSKGVKISWVYQYPRAKGKYIALCEGDDYWCDENKLQRQFDALEAYPECILSSHLVRAVSENDKYLERYYPRERDISKKVLSDEDVFQRVCSRGIAFQTSSYFFRKKAIDFDDLPPFFLNAPIGDTPLLMYLCAKGNMAYLPEEMSHYRIASENSWSRGQAVPENRIIFLQRWNRTLQSIDNYYDYKYTKYIQNAILDQEFELNRLLNNHKECLKRKYRNIFKAIPFQQKLAVIFFAAFPETRLLYLKIRYHHHE